jgi:uncharacterized protein (TIGR02453 family)
VGKVDSYATDVNNTAMVKQHFSNFPEAGLRFLRGLKRNNNRDWFLSHKKEYEEAIRKPMEELVEFLALEFARFAPEIQASPRTSLYRIYRDTRFSKDKSPYKTHVAAVFPHRNLGKHEGAGFYFHIAPDDLLIGGGLYSPLPEDLQAVRAAIASEHRRLEEIARERRFRKLFGEVSGEQLSRVPRGFPADHPAARYLKYKQFLAAQTLPAAEATLPRFRESLVETFEALLPLVRFLNEPILANRRQKDRQEELLR